MGLLLGAAPRTTRRQGLLGVAPRDSNNKHHSSSNNTIIIHPCTSTRFNHKAPLALLPPRYCGSRIHCCQHQRYWLLRHPPHHPHHCPHHQVEESDITGGLPNTKAPPRGKAPACQGAKKDHVSLLSVPPIIISVAPLLWTRSLPPTSPDTGHGTARGSAHPA